MTAILFAPEALDELFEAIEEVLSSWTYPERLNGSDPVCHLHPDTLIALEDAYDRVVDAILAANADPEPAS